MVWSLRRRRFCSKVGGGALYLAMVEEVVRWRVAEVGGG